MDRYRWQQFKEVVVDALEHDRREWPSLLVARCGDDVDLFLDATSLLAASRSVGDFIKAPAWRGMLGTMTAWRSTESR